MGRLALAASLSFASFASGACAPGPRWVTVQAFAAPSGPNVSWVAVYEPWSPTAVVDAKSGEVLAPSPKDVRVTCVNVPCEITKDGVYIDKKPPNVDHVEVLVEGKEPGFEPVRLTIPFGDDAPGNARFVVVLRKKVAP